MAMTLGDMLLRRTHLAFETADQARSLAPAVAELVGPLLGGLSRVESSLEEYDQEVRRVFSVVP
jgi:glycerol-3-phosphate dehydrogenase